LILKCIERKKIPFCTICSGVKSGLQVYNYQDDLTIRYKRTKNIRKDIKIKTLKKSLTYNMDEKKLIYTKI